MSSVKGIFRFMEKFSVFRFLRIFSALLFIFVLVSGVNAHAQTKDTKGGSGGKKKVIKLKEIVIKQRVIKPQAMIVLTRSQQALVKSDIVTSQNFSQEIIKTLESDVVK